VKKLAVLVIIVMLVANASVAFAAPGDNLPPDPGGTDIPGTAKFIHLGYQILNFVGTIGIFVVVLAFMVTGYKIVFSQDPRARGEAMHSLIPISVGAFVAFGARWLASFIQGFARSM